MDSIIATFHIDWKIIVAQAINFVIVIGVLYFFALKPLNKLMEERKERITKGLDDAKRSSELLQKAGEEYKENTIKLRQISIDAERELNQELEKLRVKNLDKIKADNNEWTKKRMEQMEIDKKALIEGAKSEVISLAMQATEKLLNEKVRPSFNEKAINDLKHL